MKNELRKHLPAVFLLGILFFIFYPTLGGEFSLVEDHDIAELTGWGFSTSQFWTKIAAGDFFTKDGRFFPLYWILRYTEGYVMGFDPELWRWSRIGYVFLTALLIYRCAISLLSPLAAAICTLLFFTRFTSVIYIHLGQPENMGIIFALLGISRLVMLIEESRFHLKAHVWPLTVIALSGFIKESFIPLMPVVALFIYGVFPRVLEKVFKTSPEFILKRKELWYLFPPAFLLLLQVIGVGYNLNHYGNSYFPNLSHLFALESRAVSNIFNHSAWLIPVGFILVNWVFTDDYLWWNPIHFSILVLSVLSVGLIPQWLIYKERLFLDERFLTLPVLFLTAASIISVWFLSTLSSTFLGKNTYGMALGGLLLVGVMSSAQVRQRAALEAQQTRVFQSEVNKILELKKSNPQEPILFCANTRHEEQVVSVSRYLSAKNRQHVHPYLKLDLGAAGGAGQVPPSLLNLSERGSHLFAPITEFEAKKGKCIGVYFSGQKQHCNCEELVIISNLLDGTSKS